MARRPPSGKPRNVGSQRRRSCRCLLVYGVRYVITYDVQCTHDKSMQSHDNLGTATTRRPRGSLTPDVILDAAERVAEQGFDALTMRAVAAELGVAPMALYSHFPTKERARQRAARPRARRASSRPPRATTGRGPARVHARPPARAERPPVGGRGAVQPPEPRPRRGPDRRGRARDPDRGGLLRRAAVATFSGLLALNYGWSSFATARAADPDRRGRSARDAGRAAAVECSRTRSPSPPRWATTPATGTTSRARPDARRNHAARLAGGRRRVVVGLVAQLTLLLRLQIVAGRRPRGPSQAGGSRGRGQRRSPASSSRAGQGSGRPSRCLHQHEFAVGLTRKRLPRK